MLQSVSIMGQHPADLASLVEVMKSNNTALQVQEKRYLKALNEKDVVGSLADPSVNLGYFLSPVETRSGGQRFQLGLQQKLPWFGTLKAAGNFQESQALIEKQKLDVISSRVEQQVKQVWYEGYLAHNQIKLLEAQQDILKRQTDLATNNFASGENGGLVDVLKVEMESLKLDDQIASLNDLVVDYSEKLQLLLGVDENPQINWDVDLEAPELEAALLLIDTEAQSDLALLDQRSMAVDAGQAWTARLNRPQFQVGFNYLFIEKRDIFFSDPENGKNALLANIGFTLPIFRKKNQAKLRRWELESESIDLERNDLERKLILKAQELRRKFDRQMRKIQLANQLLAQQSKVEQVQLESYAADKGNIEGLLQIQSEKLKLEIDRLKAITTGYQLISQLETLR